MEFYLIAKKILLLTCTHPGLCTMSLRTRTASSLLMFSKLMSFTWEKNINTTGLLHVGRFKISHNSSSKSSPATACLQARCVHLLPQLLPSLSSRCRFPHPLSRCSDPQYWCPRSCTSLSVDNHVKQAELLWNDFEQQLARVWVTYPCWESQWWCSETWWSL